MRHQSSASFCRITGGDKLFSNLLFNQRVRVSDTMRPVTALASILLLTAHANLQAQNAGTSSNSCPPTAPVRLVFDDYFGTKIADPYRYMEDLKNSGVQAWLKAQNDCTRRALASLPGRKQLLKRIVELDESTSADFTDVHRLPGDLYFYQKRPGNETVYKLYMRRALSGEEKLLVDPERITLAAPNTEKGKNTIGYFQCSDDARYVAIGIVPGGSENDTEIHVIETTSGLETGDVILRAEDEGGLHWLPGNHSFVYGRLQNLAPGAPVTEVRQKYRSYLHVLGTEVDKDPAVFGYGVTPTISIDPRHFASIRTQPNSKLALGVIETGVSPNKAFYIAPVTVVGKSNSAWRKIADFPDDVSDIAIHGDDLYLLTFKNAPRYKIVRTSARKPDLASAETIIPPSEAVITGISCAPDALYAQLMDGGIGGLVRVPYGANAKVERVNLPFDGSISLFSSDPRVPGALLTMTSWTKAAAIYAYSEKTKQVTDTKLQPAGPNDDPANIESAEVKVSSYDGTLVPLSIIHAKGMRLDGSNRTLLAGYGAYGISISPFFDRKFLAWHESGGVRALCHVRGGGEYGEEWHVAGKGPTKPNSWRDFIACAEYLVDKKYTSPEHLAALGGSAGGILIGRAITERPDLFSAAATRVGEFDMLRVETTSNGVPNIPEFGSTKTKEGFEALYAMSPYHHVKDGRRYPAVMLETGINDPRVDPWQSAKMASRLQAATTSGKPVLLWVNYAGGHGDIGGTEKQIQEEQADMLSFLLWQFGVPEFQPQTLASQSR